MQVVIPRAPPEVGGGTVVTREAATAIPGEATATLGTAGGDPRMVMGYVIFFVFVDFFNFFCGAG